MNQDIEPTATHYVVQELVGTGRWVDIQKFPDADGAERYMGKLSGSPWSLRVVRRTEQTIAAHMVDAGVSR